MTKLRPTSPFKRHVFDEFPLVPVLDVFERHGHVIVQVALDGVKPEEASVEATETALTIKRRAHTGESESKQQHH